MAEESDRNVTLGAAQIAEVYLDREATLKKDREYIERAASLGVDLLVFPEYHVPTSPVLYQVDPDLDWDEFYGRLFENAVKIPGPTIDSLCEAARKSEIGVIMGVTEKEPNTAGTMYNTLVFIDSSGEYLGKRRKVKPTTHERLFHTGGTGHDIRTFDSSFGTLGGLMCGEHTNHLAGYSMLALGQEIHAGVWPTYFGDQIPDQEREDFIGIRTRYHAFTGRVPTACATGVVTEELVEDIGTDQLDLGFGTTSIIGSNGQYLEGPVFDGECIVQAEVDLRNRYKEKAMHDVTGHYNRFDIFDLTVTRQNHEPISFRDESTASIRESTPDGADDDSGPPDL